MDTMMSFQLTLNRWYWSNLEPCIVGRWFNTSVKCYVVQLCWKIFLITYHNRVNLNKITQDYDKRLRSTIITVLNVHVGFVRICQDCFTRLNTSRITQNTGSIIRACKIFSIFECLLKVFIVALCGNFCIILNVKREKELKRVTFKLDKVLSLRAQDSPPCSFYCVHLCDCFNSKFKHTET